MKGLDLSKFSKVGSNDTHTTFKHKDGHWIKVAHGGLAEGTLKQLHDLPMAEGGAVEAFQKSVNKALKQPEESKSPAHESGVGRADDDERGGDMGGYSAPSATLSYDMTARPGFADGGDTWQPDLAPDSQEIPSGAVQGAVTAGMGEAPVAGAPQMAPPPQEDPKTGLRAFLDSEDQAMASDLARGEIKPQSYADLYGKKDTMGKMGTLFGLIVGGMGSGLTHQPNVVMKMMEQELHNDLQAQESSAKNRQTFLSMAQQDPLVQAQAKKYGADTNAVAQATALTWKANATFHSFMEQIKKMPEGPQKQAAMQAAMQMAANAKGMLSDFKDIGVATAGTIAGPPDEIAPVPGQGAQAPGTPHKGILSGSAAKPTTYDNRFSAPKPILRPDAEKRWRSVLPELNPIQGSTHAKMVEQFTAAQKADRILSSLPEIYSSMAGGRSLANSIGQTISQVGGEIPYVGTVGRGAGDFISSTLGGAGGKEFVGQQQRLEQDLATALRGTNIGGDAIHHEVMVNSPQKGDTDDDLRRKMKRIEQFIRQNVDRSLLGSGGSNLLAK